MKAYEMQKNLSEEAKRQELECAVQQAEGPLHLPDHSYPTMHAQDVAVFATLAGQEIPDRPTVPGADVRLLRARLILEESLEVMEALGVTCVNSTAIQLEVNQAVTPSLEEIVKECLDLRVVTTGTLVACGVEDSQELQELVDVNNLTKFRTDKDGYRREDGKWVKPSDHPKPDIKGFLKLLEERNRE